MSILGAMILDNSKIETALDYELNQSHFVDDYEKTILSKIYEIYGKKEKVSFETLMPELMKTERRTRKKKELEDKLNWCIYYADGGDFRDDVARHKYFAKRKAIDSIGKYLREAHLDKNESPASIISSAIKSLKEVEDSDSFEDDGDITEALDELADIINIGLPEGKFIKTGIKSLDEIILGYKMGDLYMITAATGQGKSALMVSLVCNLSMKSVSTVYFALEMDKLDMLSRCVANMGKVNSFHIVQGKRKISEAESMRANTVLAGMYEREFYLYSPDGIEYEELRQKIRMKAKSGSKVFFVDQLEIIEKAAQNKIEKLTTIVRGLRVLAKELGVCIVLAHQPNMKAQKDAEKSFGEDVPTHNDMRDAPVANDPSIVIVMHRKESYAGKKTKNEDRGKALLRVSKNRIGMVGDAIVGFSPEYSRFYDLN